MASVIRKFSFLTEYSYAKLDGKDLGFPCARSNKCKTGRIMGVMASGQD